MLEQCGQELDLVNNARTVKNEKRSQRELQR